MSFHLLGASLPLATFFALSLLGSAVAWCAWRRLGALAPGARARHRADLLFALRLLPTVLAFAAAGGLVLPAYWIYEPRPAPERVGPALAVLAALGFALLASGAGRALRDVSRTRRLERRWSARARPVALSAEAARGLGAAWRFAGSHPLVAVVGVRRPRVFVEQRVLEQCDDGQLAAILAHEAGHVRSRDNLKRLLFRACPDLLALTPLAARLERDWSEAAEAAADEQAAADRGEALTVADALLRLARLAPTLEPDLAGSAIHDGGPVTRRIERLLVWQPRAEGRRRWRLLVLPVGVLLGTSVPAALPAVHAFTEWVVRRLA
jgi:Zn-dependent protease with chaperone function